MLVHGHGFASMALDSRSGRQANTGEFTNWNLFSSGEQQKRVARMKPLNCHLGGGHFLARLVRGSQRHCSQHPAMTVPTILPFLKPLALVCCVAWAGRHACVVFGNSFVA